MDKICHILDRDFVSVHFTKCVITFAFFNFSMKFPNYCKTKFLPYVTIGIFDCCFAKNLGAKF